MLMTTAGVLWGTIGPAVAFVGDHTDASVLELNLYRAVITALVLVGAAQVLRRRLHVERGSRFRVGLIGVVVAAYQAAYFAAVHEAGIAVATLIALGLGPVLAATGEAVAARRMHSAAVLGALFMSLAGLGVLVAGADEGAAEGSVAVGAALATLSGAGYATTVLISRGLVGRVSSFDLNTWSAVAAAVVLLPVAFTGLEGPGDAQGAAGILWLGLVASALAYGLYYAALNTITATSATMLALLEPVGATIIAAALFGEALTPLALLGGAMVLGAVLLLYRSTA